MSTVFCTREKYPFRNSPLGPHTEIRALKKRSLKKSERSEILAPRNVRVNDCRVSFVRSMVQHIGLRPTTPDTMPPALHEKNHCISVLLTRKQYNTFFQTCQTPNGGFLRFSGAGGGETRESPPQSRSRFNQETFRSTSRRNRARWRAGCRP